MCGACFQIMLKSHIPTLSKKATIILFYKLKSIYRPSDKIFNPHFQNKTKYKNLSWDKKINLLTWKKNFASKTLPKVLCRESQK